MGAFQPSTQIEWEKESNKKKKDNIFFIVAFYRTPIKQEHKKALLQNKGKAALRNKLIKIK